MAHEKLILVIINANFCQMVISAKLPANVPITNQICEIFYSFLETLASYNR